MKRGWFVLIFGLLSACGSTSNTATPTPVTPAPANRAPILNSLSVTPSFGVSQVTQFSMSGSGSDPDGDAVTLSWSFGDGTAGTGAAFTKTYTGDGVATVTLTVTDSRGLSARDTRTVTVGSLAGTWFGNAASLGPFVMTLTQTGGTVVGTMSDVLGSGQIGPTGAPGSISTTGAVVLRAKQAPFSDFTFTGNMEASGRRVTGVINGSGFNGQSFTMDKQ